jgi:hypothetical protein
MDVKNTLEVMDAAILGLSKLKDAMADGEVSVVEGITMSFTMAPALFAAFKDVKDMGAELKDLDQAELKILAEKGVEIAKAVMALVAK